MGKKTHRKFTEEFKREAARLSEQEGRTVEEVAADLGVSEASLWRWRKQYSTSTRPTTEAVALEGETLEQEVIRLRKRVLRLEEERAILKKAAAFFAKESE